MKYVVAVRSGRKKATKPIAFYGFKKLKDARAFQKDLAMRKIESILGRL